jgi:hypothetical protein
VAVRLVTSQEELGPEFVVLSGGHGLYYSNGDTVFSVSCGLGRASRQWAPRRGIRSCVFVGPDAKSSVNFKRSESLLRILYWNIMV